MAKEQTIGLPSLISKQGERRRSGISLSSPRTPPDPLIGVHPVRYTVTAEDVKRSRIQLTDLVAYEIPAKTEVLLNYPNPFNPETWIPYRLAVDAFVTVKIYDQRGRVVRDYSGWASDCGGLREPVKSNLLGWENRVR